MERYSQDFLIISIYLAIRNEYCSTLHFIMVCLSHICMFLISAQVDVFDFSGVWALFFGCVLQENMLHSTPQFMCGTITIIVLTTIELNLLASIII